jgi:tRNA(Ile)-lysidine synthase
MIPRLVSSLRRLPPPRAFYVAYSGGMDSTVLLHAMAAARNEIGSDIRAIHIDHGLNPRSAEWAAHCVRFCDRLGIELLARRIDARPAAGESPEAAARDARYRALADLIGEGGCVLTAHHQDDQAETVLLQLLRGAGPRGLAAMPFVVRFAKGWHARPLLDLPREWLRRYALDHRLAWIDDPSNLETGLRRNFLRHVVVPRLKEQWPAAAGALARSAAHCAGAAELLRELAREDLRGLMGPAPRSLRIEGLKALTPARCANALREWVHQLGLPLPRAADLDRLMGEVVAAAADRSPVLSWPGAEIRRYRGLIYAMPSLPALGRKSILAWDLKPTALPAGGMIDVERVEGRGLSLIKAASGAVTLRLREGGEHCRPAGRGHRRPLKKLLQESAIPPWLRARLPLVFIGEELAAVPGVCICEGYEAQPGEVGLELRWRLG